MPQFDPTWFTSQIFWLAVSFLILYTLISRFLLPPILESIERRATTIEDAIKGAQEMKIEAHKAKTTYERALAEARAKSQSLIDGVLAEQKIKSDNAGKEMGVKITTKVFEAERSISERKDDLISSMAPVATEIAAMIVAKVAGGKA